MNKMKTAKPTQAQTMWFPMGLDIAQSMLRTTSQPTAASRPFYIQMLAGRYRKAEEYTLGTEVY